MRFDLEDRKRITQICDLLRALTSARSHVLFVWHKTEGWAVLQNQEFLDNLDSSNMVNLGQLKPHFFSHVAPEGSDFMCFELDVSNFSRVLKSVKNQIKRMVWQCEPLDEPNSRGLLRLSVIVEEGQLEIEKEVFLITRTNPSNYFRVFKEFIEEKTQYLEIKQGHMKQLKDLEKNQCVFIKFFDEFVSVYNQEDENTISIRKTALEKYDYQSLVSNLEGKNRLTIPPNFLVPQVLLGIKLKDPIQLFIGNDIVDDHISVSLRTKNDSFTFISQFKSVMERDEDDYRLNPFDASKGQAARQGLQRNPQQNELTNNFNNNQMQFRHQNNQVPMECEPQSFVSVESHIQGLTNNMHLADIYSNNQNNATPFSASPEMERGNERERQLLQQQYFQQKQQIGAQNDKLKFNQQQQQQQILNASLNSNQILSVNSTQLSGTDLNASYNPYRFSNKDYPVVMGNSTKNNNVFENPAGYSSSNNNQKRRSENGNDLLNSNILRDHTHKRIKESNYAESHAFSISSKSSFINPLISQQQQDNSDPFSVFVAQNQKRNDFSLFKTNTNQPAIQFQPQIPEKKKEQFLQQQVEEKGKFSYRKF